jgi:hypothetical protein
MLLPGLRLCGAQNDHVFLAQRGAIIFIQRLCASDWELVDPDKNLEQRYTTWLFPVDGLRVTVLEGKWHGRLRGRGVPSSTLA